MLHLMAGAQRPAATGNPPVVASNASSATAPSIAAGMGIDVLGIKIGQSDVADVRRQLGHITPPLHIEASESELALERSGYRDLPIPGSRYVHELQAVQPSGQPACADPSTCERFRIGFAAHPGNIVTLLQRFSTFPAVTEERLLASLQAKYGPYSMRRVDGGAHVSLLWGWNEKGDVQSFSTNAQRFPCAAGLNEGYTETVLRKAVSVGCSRVLEVKYFIQDQLIRSLTMTASHVAFRLDAHAKTMDMMLRYAEQHDGQQQQKAKQTSAPKL